MSSTVSKVKIRRNSRNKDASIKKLLQNRKKRLRLILLLLGIGLFYFGLNWPKKAEISPPVQPVIQNEAVSFSSEPVKIDQTLTRENQKKDKEKLPPIRIFIPDLSIDLPVSTAKVVKGYWEVFPDRAGFGLGSAYPDETGNQVIFAHAKSNLFGPLKNSKIGQKIIIFTKDKWYTYEVFDIKEVLPNQVEVIASTSDSVLTLYTCSGFSDSKRLIITSKKTS